MNEQTPRWQLQPPGTAARIFLAVFTLLLPVAVLAAVLVHAFQGNDPLRLAGDSRSLTTWVTLGSVPLLLLPLGWWLQRSLSRHRIALHDGMLEIATTFYRRTLALSDLKIDEARVVDLDERTEFKPILKTNGVGLPGFKSGWFRLRNREKALVAMAGGKRVLWVPTRKGYGLLLQPRHPQALLDELRRLAAPEARR